VLRQTQGETVENQNESVTYEQPAIVDYGDLVALTAGSSDGESTDAAFPVNTPKRSLTFS
jgi:hypothetical protein